MAKILQTTLYSILIIGLAGVMTLFLASVLPIPGQVELKIVKSGSMEPAIATGGIVVIQPSDSYGVGDVITFGEDTAVQVPTTHRIVRAYQEQGRTYFETKGDANEEADTEPVAARDVIGTVLFSVPYVGYLLDFAKQPLGFALMVGVPATLIILYELLGIFEELRNSRRSRKERQEGKDGSGSTREAARDSSIPSLYDLCEPVLDMRFGDTRSLSNRTAGSIVFGRTSPLQDMYIQYVLRDSDSKHGARFRKGAAFFALALLIPVSIAVANVEATMLYFSDLESSIGNTFAAGPLDFILTPEEALEATIGPGEVAGFALTPTVSPIANILPFSYSIRGVVGGNPAFCSALQLRGFAPPFSYDAPVSALASAPTDDLTPWNILLFVVSGAGITEGAQCEVELVYSAFQYDGAPGIKYHDEERIQILLTYSGAPPVAPLLRTLSLPLEEGPGGQVLGETTLPTEGPPAEEPPPAPPLPDTAVEPTMPEEPPLEPPAPLEEPQDPLPPEPTAPEEPPPAEPPPPEPPQAAE
ncbi:MAG: signal peptidase I [Minisyncoccia bacterium]